MRRRVLAAAPILALAAAGCAIYPNADVSGFARNSGANSFEMRGRALPADAQALVLPVVHDRQRDGPSCGAHALASVINYWRGPNTVSGDALYRATPPATASGYSMAELVALAQANGLVASPVRLARADIMRELEAGRPVLVPVRLPSIYVQQRTLPGADAPVVGFMRNALVYRAARASELTGAMLVNHYLLVAGYEGDTLVVLEPVMGFRTISADKLERFRAPFGDAAIVFSGPGGAPAKS